MTSVVTDVTTDWGGSTGSLCGEGSSLNKWSPSRCLIASTMVSKFCLEVLMNSLEKCGKKNLLVTTNLRTVSFTADFLIHYLAWSSEIEGGDGSLSTSTLGSALIAASKTLGSTGSRTGETGPKMVVVWTGDGHGDAATGIGREVIWGPSASAGKRSEGEATIAGDWIEVTPSTSSLNNLLPLWEEHWDSLREGISLSTTCNIKILESKPRYKILR